MDSMEIVVNLVHGQVRKGVRSVIKNERGATLVEYVLLIVAVAVIAVVAFRTLANQIKAGAAKAAPLM
jgi:Flp pilus assembly pilin Flp